MDTEPNYCPRCIEDYSESDGEKVEGTKTLSDCDKCGVCKECEHMLDCDNRPALGIDEEQRRLAQRTNEQFFADCRAEVAKTLEHMLDCDNRPAELPKSIRVQIRGRK